MFGEGGPPSGVRPLILRLLRDTPFMPFSADTTRHADVSNGSVIRVEGFRKTYGGTVAVSSFSFQVMPGEILGVVGPNGAGKTTTMRSLAALINPTSGRLMVDGRDVTKDPVGVKQNLA